MRPYLPLFTTHFSPSKTQSFWFYTQIIYKNSQGIPLLEAVAADLVDTCVSFPKSIFILGKMLSQNLYLDLLLFHLILLLFHHIALKKDIEQEGTCVNIHLQISTKWYQQLLTLITTVADIQQAILIFYRSAGIIKSWYRQITRIEGLLHNIDQCKWQERYFQSSFLPLFFVPSLPISCSHAVLKTSRYSCQLTPEKIHKVIQTISYPQLHDHVFEAGKNYLFK